MRRTVSWTDVLEIFVHPITVPLEPLGAGLLRDLEGTTTNDLSTSDLAFHALRDYQPGDDRRYIHWRSSAKAWTLPGAPVPGHAPQPHLRARRQRCLRLTPIPNDFETAISVAASIAVRVVQDEQEITALAGTHIAGSDAGRRILDTFSRAELTGNGLLDLARRALRIAPDMSNALLITGAHTDFRAMRHAAAQLPIEVRTMVMRMDRDQRTSFAGDASMPILTLQTLNDLGPLLSGVFS